MGITSISTSTSLGEPGDPNGEAYRRFGREVAAVSLVHRGEGVHAFQKDSGLDPLR